MLQWVVFVNALNPLNNRVTQRTSKMRVEPCYCLQYIWEFHMRAHRSKIEIHIDDLFEKKS